MRERGETPGTDAHHADGAEAGVGTARWRLALLGHQGLGPVSTEIDGCPPVRRCGRDRSLQPRARSDRRADRLAAATCISGVALLTPSEAPTDVREPCGLACAAARAQGGTGSTGAALAVATVRHPLRSTASRHILSGMGSPKPPPVHQTAPPLPKGGRRLRTFPHFWSVHARFAGSGRNGRLVLALDATMSRQPTWDMGLRGAGVDVRCGRYRAERATRLFPRRRRMPRLEVRVGRTRAQRLMTRIDCRGGHTQIGKVFTHVLRQTAERRVNASSISETPWRKGSTTFAKRPGSSASTACRSSSFRRDGTGRPRGPSANSRGSRAALGPVRQVCSGDAGELLSTIAVYATGGLKALEARGRPEDRLLIENLRGGRR